MTTRLYEKKLQRWNARASALYQRVLFAASGNPARETKAKAAGSIEQEPLVLLHCCQVWLPQTETWLHSQVQDLQGMGTQAHVVCERSENLDQFGMNNIHCLKHAGIVPFTWDRAVRKLRCRRHLGIVQRVGQAIRPHIVHSHFGNQAWANQSVARALRAKHVVTFYGYDVNHLPTRFPVWRRRYRDMFADVDRVLCEGTHMARCIVELGCPESKVRVHHLGVEVRDITCVPRRWTSGETLRVLIAASFVEKKGIPYAIDALGTLVRDVPVALTIIGDARNTPESQAEKRRIEAALDRNGLRAHTRLLGYQPHAALLREAYAHHVFLQTSITAADGDTEGGAPMSILEMLATGMPVISTRHCDIPEAVGPTLSQWLAPERNATAVADILRRLLSRANDWESFAALGRNHVASEYDRRRQSVQLLAHYQEVLAGA